MMRLVSVVSLTLSAYNIAPVNPPAESQSTVDTSQHVEVVIGLSVEKRPIIARRYGALDGKPVLAVGSIHGNEQSGIAIVRALARSPVPDGYVLWVIEDVNPDGGTRRSRQNSRGVDLNRNFPIMWKKNQCPSKYCSGKAPVSEPETVALIGFLESKQPSMTIFYHSVGDFVDVPSKGLENRKVLGAYAARASIPLRTADCGSGGCTGNATMFTNYAIAWGSAFVVELPCDNRCLTVATIKRHWSAFWYAARFSGSRSS